MSNPLIIDAKTDELKLGYPVNINQNVVRRFTAFDGDVPIENIPFGDVLILGGSTKVYKSVENEVAGTVTLVTQVVGINLSTNVKLNTFFPIGTTTTNTVETNGGDDGNNIVKGEVAVEYIGSVPDENDGVYLITDNGDQVIGQLGKLSADAASVGTETKLLLPKFSWSGITQAADTLSVVKLDLE